MAKNRKIRRQELEAAGLAPNRPVSKASKVAPPPPPPKGPAVTPKKPKVKRPRYVRPPRGAPKAAKAPEPTGPKPQSYAAITLTSSVAKAIPKPGVELPDRPGIGPAPR